MGALGIAFGIGKKIFKGLRSRRKQKKLDRKSKKLKAKEAEAQKALSALIVGGTGQTSYSQPLDFAQELVFPEVDQTFGSGGGKIFKPRRGLNRTGIASSFTEGETVLSEFNLKSLPMWAKALALIVAAFVGWKLFFSKKRRR
jgi:hypothetical protein